MKTAKHRLVAWLGALGWTYSRLAVEIGRDPSYVSHLAAGRCVPSLEVAVAIEKLSATWAHGPIRPDEWLRPAEDVAA